MAATQCKKQPYTRGKEKAIKKGTHHWAHTKNLVGEKPYSREWCKDKPRSVNTVPKKTEKLNPGITRRLRALAKALDKKELHPLEDAFLKNSYLPALEALLKHEVNLIAVIALGDLTTIQDWINSYDSEAELFEATGRIFTLANMLAAQGVQEVLKEQELCEECQGHHNGIPKEKMN